MQMAQMEGAEDVGETVGAAGSHAVGVDKHHVAYGEEGAAKDEQHVGKDFLLNVFLFHR